MQANIKGFNNEEDFLVMKEVCNNISKKDKTFSFITQTQFEGNNKIYVISLLSEDKNVLHKRAEWLIHKIDFPNNSMPYYDVIE